MCLLLKIKRKALARKQPWEEKSLCPAKTSHRQHTHSQGQLPGSKVRTGSELLVCVCQQDYHQSWISGCPLPSPPQHHPASGELHILNSQLIGKLLHSFLADQPGKTPLFEAIGSVHSIPAKGLHFSVGHSLLPFLPLSYPFLYSFLLFLKVSTLEKCIVYDSSIRRHSSRY